MNEHNTFWLILISGLSVGLYVVFFLSNVLVIFLSSFFTKVVVEVGRPEFLLPSIQVLILFALYILVDSQKTGSDAAYSGAAPFIGLAVILAVLCMLFGIVGSIVIKLNRVSTGVSPALPTTPCMGGRTGRFTQNSEA